MMHYIFQRQNKGKVSKEKGKIQTTDIVILSQFILCTDDFMAHNWENSRGS